MMRLARLPLAAAALFLVVSCHGDRATTANIGSPSAAISDGAHEAGNPDFFFLPPMVPNPSTNQNFNTADFNSSLAPVVQICAGAATPKDKTECVGAEIAEFTTTNGPGSETVRLGDQHYIVNWHTNEFDLASGVYRIRVIVGTTVLGHADVELGANRGELKNVVTEEVVPLVDGRTLPIRFRIEVGAACFDVDPCTQRVINLSEDNTIILEGTDDRVDIPAQNAGGVSGVITVTVQLCDRQEGIQVDLRKFGNCLTITSNPPLGESRFSPAATVSMCSVLAGSTDSEAAAQLAALRAQRDLVTMHRQDDGDIFALPQGGPFCDEPSDIGSGPSNLFQQLARSVGRLFAPRPLHAATTVLDVGPSGETDFFSDFQLALPAQMFPADGTDDISGEAGGEASPVPAVVMMDAGDPRSETPPQPVAGALVTFRITGGDGNFGTDDGDDPITEVQVLSDENGRAAVPVWILGNGEGNTVTASGRGFAGPTDDGPFMPEIHCPVEEEEPCQETVQLPDPLDDREVVFTATGTAPGEILYGVNSGDDGLSTINPSTGAATFIGRLHPDVNRFVTPVAMASRPSDGTLFVWNNSDIDSETGGTIITGVLLTVDRCTGLATEVNPSAPNQGTVGALAYSPTGTLFGLSSQLSQINTTTGVRTLIGELGPAAGSAFAADFLGATLYGVSGGGTLFTVNSMTGAATVVGTLTPAVGTLGSIVTDPTTGTLIGSAFGGPSGDILFDINPATAAVSNVRPVTGGSAPQGMGFAPPCTS